MDASRLFLKSVDSWTEIPSNVEEGFGYYLDGSPISPIDVSKKTSQVGPSIVSSSSGELYVPCVDSVKLLKEKIGLKSEEERTSSFVTQEECTFPVIDDESVKLPMKVQNLQEYISLISQSSDESSLRKIFVQVLDLPSGQNKDLLLESIVLRSLSLYSTARVGEIARKVVFESHRYDPLEYLSAYEAVKESFFHLPYTAIDQMSSVEKQISLLKQVEVLENKRT